MSGVARVTALILPLALGGLGIVDLPPADRGPSETDIVKHRTQTGAVLDLPPLSGQSCGEIRRLLRRIDRSNYRGRALLGPGHADYRVFLYEDALAATLYFDCTLRETRLADPQAVFSAGFGSR